MDKRAHFSIGYLLFAFLVMFFIQSILYGPNVETIPYRDFAQLVKQGKIQSIVPSDKMITATPTPSYMEALKTSGKPPSWKLRKHQILMTVQVQDPQLVSLLLTHHARLFAKLEMGEKVLRGDTFRKMIGKA